jgi:hypothetical protein
MQITTAQTSMFWRLYAQAERETLPPSATRQERSDFRHDLIFKATGQRSLKNVSRTTGFDKLMLETATLAGDYEAAGRYINGSERRYVHLIGECARQIGEIADVPHGWDYCQSTFKQAGLPKHWEDIPETLLASTFKMLDTHRRRMLKRDYLWDTDLGFHPDRSYVHIHQAVVKVDHPHHHSPPFAASA